jgi:hypothetical protein
MLTHRLTLWCDHPGCSVGLVSPPVAFYAREHGLERTLVELLDRADTAGWVRLPGELPEEPPRHYCPKHGQYHAEG